MHEFWSYSLYIFLNWFSLFILLTFPTKTNFGDLSRTKGVGSGQQSGRELQVGCSWMDCFGGGQEAGLT